LTIGSAKKALFLLEQIRDEAHRFAIGFQRKKREKRGGLSFLDGISGIGPKKKKMLLTRFKGLENMKKASVDELASLPGITQALAKALLIQLKSG